MLSEPHDYDDDDLGQCPQYCALYPSGSVEEHLALVKKLRHMRLRDKYSFDNICVIDARNEIIGPHNVDSTPIPIIDTREIFVEEWYHRYAGDGMVFPRIPQPRPRVGGSVAAGGTLTLENATYSAYTCMLHHDDGISNVVTFEEYVYPHPATSETILSYKSFRGQMAVVHDAHIAFLTEMETIDRELFLCLARTYDRDPSLPHTTLCTMLDLLISKYTSNQWEVYNCTGEKPSYWSTSSLRNRMDGVYDAHLKWLKQDDLDLDHVAHQKWIKLYNSDPILDAHVREYHISYLDEHLKRHIDSFEVLPSLSEYHTACIEYYQNKCWWAIDFVPDRFAVPFFLWA